MGGEGGSGGSSGLTPGGAGAAGPEKGSRQQEQHIWRSGGESEPGVSQEEKVGQQSLAFGRDDGTKEPGFLGSRVSGKGKPRRASAFPVQWKPLEGSGQGGSSLDPGYTKVGVAVTGEPVGGERGWRAGPGPER